MNEGYLRKTPLTAYERETIITFSDESNEVDIYTASRMTMTKLDKLCKSSPEMYKLKSSDGVSKTYTCASKRFLSFRAKDTKGTRQLTEEQREAAREHLRKLRAV